MKSMTEKQALEMGTFTELEQIDEAICMTSITTILALIPNFFQQRLGARPAATFWKR